tara:strand:- start:89 stop:760 length:672 start_codon:yes stop_codon:yes gene_type:complete
MATVSVSIAVNPRDKTGVLVKLQSVVKAKGYDDFEKFKNDALSATLKQMTHFQDEKTGKVIPVTISVFKLILVAAPHHTEGTGNLKILESTTWQEIHQAYISQLRNNDTEWYMYGGKEMVDVKLGFDYMTTFSYWHSPWNTVEDNDCIFVTRTKRRGADWKTLCATGNEARNLAKKSGMKFTKVEPVSYEKEKEKKEAEQIRKQKHLQGVNELYEQIKRERGL